MAKRHTTTGDTLEHWAFDGDTGDDEVSDGSGANTAVDVNNDVPSVAMDLFGDGRGMRDVSGLGWNRDAFQVTGVPAAWHGIPKLTISVWWYMLDNSQVLFSCPLLIVRDGGAYPLSFAYYSFNLSASMTTNGSGVNVFTSGGLTVGKHLSTFVYDGVEGFAKLFHDGVLVRTDSSVGALTAIASGNIEIGCGDRSTHAAIPGYIGDTIVDAEAHDLDWHVDLWTGIDRLSMPDDKTSGPYQLISGADNNYELDNRGRLKRDATIASRCRARLCIRLGEWVPNKKIGSRLHTINTMRDARIKARIFIDEALDPLVKSGEISEINLIEYVESPTTGQLGVSVEIVLPSKDVVPIGIVAIGEAQ